MEMHYRVSLWNYLFYHRPGSLERVVEDVRDAGYGVELFPRWFDEDNLYDPVYRERLRMLVGDMPSSLHGGGPDTMEQHQLQIETAADTESDVIVVHTSHMRLEGQEPEFTFAQNVLDLANERGVTIALETGALSILERALRNLNGLRICLDTGHVYHHPEPMQAFVDALRKDICHLHIEDSLGETEHYAPGTGIIPIDDWRYLLEKLDETGFNGASVLEIRPRKPLQHAEATKVFFEELVLKKH
jgi:sugar phosphate isomerase/epimerase